MKTKALEIILFILCIVCFIVAIILAFELGEVEVFELAGVVRHMWICYVFIPVGIGSIALGIAQFKRNRSKKNIIVGCASVAMLLLAGTIGTVGAAMTNYNPAIVYEKCEIVGIDFPRDIEVATNEEKTFNVTAVRINDKRELNNFVASLKNSDRWVRSLPTTVYNSLTEGVQFDLTEGDDYFLMYDCVTEEYNSPPTRSHEYIIFVYDVSIQRVLLITDLQITT